MIRHVILVFSIGLFFLSGPTVFGQSRADSLKQVVNTLPDDSTRVNALVELAELTIGLDPAEGQQVAQSAVDLAQKIQFTKGLANSYKYLGLAYYNQDLYMEATLNYQEAIRYFEEVGDRIGVSNIYSNLGTIYTNQGDDEKALEWYLRSLRIAEEVNDQLRICTVSINIGQLYQKKPATLNKAEQYLKEAIRIAGEIDYGIGLGYGSVNLGEVYFDMGNDSLALVYFERAGSVLQNSLAMPYVLINIGKVYLHDLDYLGAKRVLEKAYDLAKENNTKLYMSMALMGLADVWIKLDNDLAAISTLKEAIEIAEEIGAKESLRDAFERLAIQSAEVRDFESAYYYQKELTAVKDSLFNSANEKRLNLMMTNFNLEKKEKELEVQELVTQKQRLLKNASVAGLVMILVIAFIILRNYLVKARINKILDKQNEEIEGLLLNILPEEVAHELQKTGAATPKSYASVSVLFTDFAGFSSIAKDLSPEVLVGELSSFFIGFDAICEKYNLEKIKTIGDAYMCAGGIPTENSTHPTDAVMAGLEMQQFMDNHNSNRISEGKVPWGLRVGIHTGHVVAGVVGKKKYAYDIWGSAVNVASRMESNGEAGKVNISSSTYELIGDQFNCHYRGKISAKNVGEIDMYFVEKT